MKADGFSVELEALTAFLCVQVDGVRHIVEWRDVQTLAKCLDGLRMRFSAESTEWGWDSGRFCMTVRTIDGHGGRMTRDQAHRLAEGVRKMAESYEDWRIRQQMDRWGR